MKQYAIALSVLFFAAPTALQGEPAARVFLNGEPAPVYFNDGDSFRVLAGTFQGTKARLAGFNTLESYGPVHQWGNWTAKELYYLSKMATTNGRNGVWHCESKDLAKDTYGRILWYCQDLAVDQIRKGLAHAMTVTSEPAKPELLAAQREAIKNRRGMWAHGVPEYVLTSLHSAAEGGGSDGRTYNRLVSTIDGHSEKWLHTDRYGECDKVCGSKVVLPKSHLDEVTAKIRESATIGPLFSEMTDSEVHARINLFRSFGTVGWMNSKDDAYRANDALADWVSSSVEPVSQKEQGCMIYVDFRRRYGGKRASCLK